MKTKLMFLIILISLILRFYNLGINPASLDWDEASLSYNAYSILKTGMDEYGNFLPLSIRSFNDYKPPLYTYLTVLPVYFIGLNEFSTRFISAVMGFIAVISVYYISTEIIKTRKIALLAAFFLAVSPWHLQFSRIAFEANTALTLILLGILFFLKGFKGKINLSLSALFFGFALFAYHSPRLIVPILISGLVLIYFKRLKFYLLHLFIFASILAIFYLPVLRDLGKSTGARFSSVSVINPDEKLGQSIKAIDFDRQKGDYLGTLFHNRRIIFGREILAGYLDHFNFDFLFLSGDPPGRHHASGMGMLYIMELPLLIIGLFVLLKNLKNDYSKLILLQFLVAPLASMLTSGTPHAVRSIYFLPTYQFFSSFGLLALVNYFKGIGKYNRSPITLLLFLAVFYSGNVYYYLHQYYIHTPLEYASEWQFGYKEAVSVANLYEGQVSKIIFTYQYDQPYVYFLFYNQIDPSWYQQNWGEGEIDRKLRKFGKYEFRNIDWEKDKNLNNTLLIGTPKEIPENAQRKITEIKFPDGSVAFRVVLR